jgi:hypothetical protein
MDKNILWAITISMAFLLALAGEDGKAWVRGSQKSM